MKNKKALLIALGIIIVLLDQIVKVILIDKNIILIPSVLSFTYTQNTGTAFGIGNNNTMLIIILNIIILGIIIKLLKERKDGIELNTLLSLILILAGGISNLFDRIFRGYVIDFIDINLLNFPSFNIADISIVIGIVLLGIQILKNINQKEDKKVLTNNK